jgi:ferritin-like metal-binding protein YciE
MAIIKVILIFEGKMACEKVLLNQKSKGNKMKLDTLQDLLVNKVTELYTAEKRSINLMPRFAEACNSQEVRDTFKQHLDQTRNQVDRLEQVFTKLDVKPHETNNPVFDGFEEYSKEILSSKGDPDVKDAALIAAEQDIEHYEIAGYGAARSYAQALKLNDVRNLLQKTLNEEGYTDVKLSKISDKGYSDPAINKKAAEK